MATSVCAFRVRPVLALWLQQRQCGWRLRRCCGGEILGVMGVENPANLVGRGALSWYASDRSDQTAEFLRRHIFTMRRARSLRDIFFHQRAAEIVRAGVQAR